MENIKRIDGKRVEIDGQVYILDEPCENRIDTKQSNRFKPDNYERYYFAREEGDVDYNTWNDDYIDHLHFAIGNCFRTLEEAEFMVEKLKVLVELSEFTEPKDRPWDGTEKHWSFYWNIEVEKMEYSYNAKNKNTRLYFESEKIAQQAVATVGQNRIKKFLLGAEND